MGANQSSKSPSGARSSLKQSGQQPAQQQSNNKLSASLRKSVNNVLAQGKNKSPSKAKQAELAADSGAEKSANGLTDDRLVGPGQQPALGESLVDDSYYVSLARSKTFAPGANVAVMNNYVTMQQQHRSQLEQQQRQRGNTIEPEANEALYCAGGGANGNFYEAALLNNIGSNSGGVMHNTLESHNMLAPPATAASRSTPATTKPFQHLSSRLNATANSANKTAASNGNVLNINSQPVAMPNIASSTSNQNGSQQKQQQQIAANSSGSATSGSVQSSPSGSAAGLAATQQHYYQQQPAYYHHPTYRSAGQLYATPPDRYSQYAIYRGSEDAENANYYASARANQQVVRYKSPKQQYQYHNNNNLQQPSAILDFHQASLQQHQQVKVPLIQSRASLLDCNIYAGDTRPAYAGSARTLDSRKKKSIGSSKLASVFQTTASNKHHSNTIHLTSHRHNSKSQRQAGNLKSSFSGSLKRIKSNPLTAQQASYEAMRTIDMYMIRQIARSCMDFEMEQKIDLEIRLRELAAQSMLEAQTEIDVLEVEKSLLTSDQRMNCYAAQLEQQRKQLSNPSLSTDSGRGSKSGNGATASRQHRADVIPATGAGSASGHTDTTSSPSFSSLSNSQSPSKLSPVSGESANSQPSFTSSHHSRGTGYRNRHSSSSGNTLNSRQRAKNKKREQLMQSIAASSNINCNMVTNTRASVSISELRIPLMWRDVDHFKGRGDYKRFAVFCLLKIDSQIYDTQLISDVDRDVTDVTFEDVVVFNEIDHNFELTLEVYSCVYLEQFSLSSTPRKLKEKLTSSVSRAMGRRLTSQTASTNYTRELQAYDKSYRFAMIASATLRLQDASDSVKTYDLVLMSPSAHHRHHSQASSMNHYSSSSINPSSPPQYSHHHVTHNMTTTTATPTGSNKDVEKNTLPLFGHFCAKLLVKPDVFERGTKAGYLRVAIISNTNAGGRKTADSTGGDESAETMMLRQALAASTKMATLSMSCSNIHWGLLRNFALHLWPVDDRMLDYNAVLRGEPPHLDSKVIRRPQVTLNIDKYARLIRVSNSSLTIETADKSCYVLAAYCPTPNNNATSEGLMNQADEIGQWLRSIEQHIYDSHIWGTVLNHYPPHAKQPTTTQAISTNGSNNNSQSSNLNDSDHSIDDGRLSARKCNSIGKQQQQHHHQQLPPRQYGGVMSSVSRPTAVAYYSGGSSNVYQQQGTLLMDRHELI